MQQEKQDSRVELAIIYFFFIKAIIEIRKNVISNNEIEHWFYVLKFIVVVVMYMME